MFNDKSQRVSLLRIASIFIIICLAASCGGAQAVPTDIVMQYYSAIENEDSNSAASFFADDALVVTPSGKVITGIDEIKEAFILYDLQNMDRVEFLTDFSESNGRLSWSQTYHEVNGFTFTSDCEITLENGKIVEWLLQ